MASFKIFVPGSEGTVAYLQIIYYVIIANLCKTMLLTDRIYYLWYSVFFLDLKSLYSACSLIVNVFVSEIVVFCVKSHR